MIRIKKTYFRCFHICPGKDDCLGSCAESEMSLVRTDWPEATQTGI